MRRSLGEGGSPLLQQGELDFQSSENMPAHKIGFSRGTFPELIAAQRQSPPAFAPQATRRGRSAQAAARFCRGFSRTAQIEFQNPIPPRGRREPAPLRRPQRRSNNRLARSPERHPTMQGIETVSIRREGKERPSKPKRKKSQRQVCQDGTQAVIDKGSLNVAGSKFGKIRRLGQPKPGVDSRR